MCSPTRHNIYTGLYPVKSGAYPNHTFAKDGTKSIVHYLRPLGYRVHLSGKTHINPREVFPFEYTKAGNNPDMAAIDTLFGECTGSDTPFCLFACSNEPHSPWNKGDSSRYDANSVKLPPYFVDTQKTRSDYVNYLAEITYYDEQVGQILDLLKKHKAADNTMVMVVSEQGSGFPFGKWTCYETGLQSACIVRWPGHVKPNTVSNAMIEYVDVTPTFVEAAGGRPAEILDGKSILPVLRGETTSHKQYVYGLHTTKGIINGSDHFGIRSIRGERYKLIWNLSPEVKFTNACTRSPVFKSWIDAATTDSDAADKVKRYHYRPGIELFDLESDPLEWTNLVDDPTLADVKGQLLTELKRWMDSQGDKGRQTELEAESHQSRNRKDRGKGRRKKKAA
jgi:N-sulfoglucosamine sulfohydrolase